MHGKEEMRWYMSAGGPALIDISDGFFARQVLDDTGDKDEDDATLVGTAFIGFDSRLGSASEREIWKDTIQLRYSKRQVPVNGIISYFRWQLSKHSPNERI